MVHISHRMEFGTKPNILDENIEKLIIVPKEVDILFFLLTVKMTILDRLSFLQRQNVTSSGPLIISYCYVVIMHNMCCDSDLDCTLRAFYSTVHHLNRLRMRI